MVLKGVVVLMDGSGVRETYPRLQSIGIARAL